MASSAAPVPTLLVSSAVTPDDHGKIVLVVGWLCLIAGVLCTLARLQIRWPLPALAGTDDYLCAAAAGLAIVQTAVTFRAVDDGFGKTESNLGPKQVVNVEKVRLVYSSYSRTCTHAREDDICHGHTFPALPLDRKALRVISLPPPGRRLQQI